MQLSLNGKRKRDIRLQERFGETNLVAYGLIRVISDGVGCDRVARGDHLNKCDIEEPATSLGGVRCDLDDLFARGDNSSKFGA